VTAEEGRVRRDPALLTDLLIGPARGR